MLTRGQMAEPRPAGEPSDRDVAWCGPTAVTGAADPEGAMSNRRPALAGDRPRDPDRVSGGTRARAHGRSPSDGRRDPLWGRRVAASTTGARREVVLGERGEPWWDAPSVGGRRRRIEATIRALLHAREPGASICPSDLPAPSAGIVAVVGFRSAPRDRWAGRRRHGGGDPAQRHRRRDAHVDRFASAGDRRWTRVTDQRWVSAAG